MTPVNEITREVPLETSTPPAAAEFDLLDLLLVLAARKRVIFLATAAGLLIAAILAFFVIRPMFTAEAVIMPPQQEQSSTSALLGQFGALASMSGVGSSLGLKSPNDLYLGILKSDTIADRLIKRFNLMQLYHEKLLSNARRDLAKRSKFLSGKDSLINISVDDHDPHRAAAMANAYVTELHNLNDHLAITQASQHRVFLSSSSHRKRTGWPTRKSL